MTRLGSGVFADRERLAYPALAEYAHYQGFDGPRVPLAILALAQLFEPEERLAYVEWAV